MWSKVKAKYFLGMFLVFFISGTTTQWSDVALHGIESQGDVPKGFLHDLTKSREVPSDADVSLRSRDVKEFWLTQRYHMNKFMLSGKVSYGDKISAYLSNIKDELLSNDPKLKEYVSIYTSSDPQVNAFSSQLGQVVANIGLIARANSEAEIAFILAHEIAHVKENHGIERYSTLNELENSRAFKKLWTLEKLDHLTARTQEQEFEADKLGAEIILKSPYSVEAMNTSLNMLSREYLPFKQVKIERDFLPLLNIKIPAIHFREELDPINPEEDYFDETSSHPNLKKRRDAIKTLIGNRKGGTQFLQSEERFYEIRELARYEVIRQEIVQRNYGNAIYHSIAMMDGHGANEFLELSIGKSLFGLAFYKLIDEYDEVAESYLTMQGESQQVHYFLRQLDKTQLSAIALKYLLSLQKKYPDDKKVKILTRKLCASMVIYGGFSPESFSKIKPIDSEKTFDIKDYGSEREKIRAEQSYFKDYYHSLLLSEMESHWFESAFEPYYNSRDSFQKMKYVNDKDLEKAIEGQTKLYHKKGTGLKIRDLAIVGPVVESVFPEPASTVNESVVGQVMVSDYLEKELTALGVKYFFLNENRLLDEGTAAYNTHVKYYTFLRESMWHFPYHRASTFLEIPEILKEESPKHICYIAYLYQNGYGKYMFIVLNPVNGDVEYKRVERTSSRLTPSAINAAVSKDLFAITH